MIGQGISHYRITAKLGEGGMGAVYRATDLKLSREVALKVLPEAFAQDAERMARFQREAQVLASLNHPNIAAVYGLEESGGVRALAMELVEGPTLAEKIRVAQGPRSGPPAFQEPEPRTTGVSLQVDEALGIAKQIAEALEYAHERGIIHRDLKPANIKITLGGTVKVLDFGLAKAVDTEGSASNISGSPTLTMAATQAGVILGTAAYMSPEQAKGKKVDRRADIWAFGCVLYEMLTGAHAFEGETTSEVLAEVIKSEPNWDALPSSIQPSLRQLLRRSLTKDPKQRLQAIGDARIAMDEILTGVADVGADQRVRPERDAHMGAPLQTGRRALPWVAAAILICLAIFGGWWLGSRRATPQPRWSGDLLGGSTIAFGPRVSPDGRTLAFQAMVDNITQVAVMNPDSGNWTVLTHDRTSGPVHEIAWSPDGSKLYFDRVSSEHGEIYSVPSLGGDIRLVLRDAACPEVLPDGSLLVWRLDAERKERIYRFWPDSGQLRPMGGWIVPTFPVSVIRAFPDGKEAVFFGWNERAGAGASPQVCVLDIASGEARPLAAQLPIRQTSESFPMAPTPDNTSVLLDLPSGNLHQIVAVPRSGSGPFHVLMTLTTPPWTIDAGSDGSIYLDQVDRPYQILRFPTTGGTPEVLATAPTHPPELSVPVEFPDGRFLLPSIVSGRSQLLMGKPGGSFFPLADTTEENRLPATLLPENEVAFVAGTGPGQTIAIASAVDGRIIRRLQGCKGKYVTSLAASPDGKTLYYSAEGTVWAIPATDGRAQKVSGGDGAAVGPNGKELIVNSFEKAGVRLVRISLSGGPAQEIPIQSGLPVDPLPLGGNSLRKDNKLLIGVEAPDSWFFSAALLDLASGKLTRIPVNYTGDLLQSGWTSDGRVLTLGDPMQAHLWRFRPLP